MPVRAITFAYAGMARRELESARAIAAGAGVQEHRIVRLPDLKEAGAIPGFDLHGRPPTYIPLRNSIFYSFAGSIAEEVGAVSIVGGHNKDDEMVFADVKQGFFTPLQKALWEASPVLKRNRAKIVRPLRLLSKAEVVRLAASRGVPLALTWSCHRDGRNHCWRCPGCKSRREAFHKAGVTDPLFGGS